jgi:hypothetical protein
MTLPLLTVKWNVKEVNEAIHASRNWMLAAIQYCDYVATAIRRFCRVSMVIYFECYGLRVIKVVQDHWMTNRLEIKQDLHQAHWEVERHYRRQNTMA